MDAINSVQFSNHTGEQYLPHLSLINLGYGDVAGNAGRQEGSLWYLHTFVVCALVSKVTTDCVVCYVMDNNKSNGVCLDPNGCVFNRLHPLQGTSAEF